MKNSYSGRGKGSNDTSDRVERLRKDVLAYLRQVKPEITADEVRRTFDTIKAAAFEAIDYRYNPVPSGRQNYLDRIPKEHHRTFNPVIAHAFSPEHYPKLKEFVNTWESIQADDFWGHTEPTWLDKARSFYESEYRDGDFDGEVIITPALIEVVLFRYIEGFKDALPKGGRYAGKGSGHWRYECTPENRAIFERGEYYRGLPVYVDPELTHTTREVQYD